MTHIRNIATGAVSYVPARGLAVAGQVVSRTTSGAALAALGYEWCEPPVVETPALTEAEIQAAKPLRLKQAENAFLASVVAACQALGVDPATLPAVTVSALTAAADASGAAESKIAKWEARLNSRWMDVLYAAGVTAAAYDALPNMPHQL